MVVAERRGWWGGGGRRIAIAVVRMKERARVKEEE